MTLPVPWDITEEANVVTSIFGHNENSGDPNDPTATARNSAIPDFLDEGFHGDDRQSLPSTISTALGSKTLEEYTDPFPNFRINTAVEIGFDTDGRTVLNGEYDALYDDPSMQNPSSVSSITREGGPGESTLFVTILDSLDGADNFLPANVKGPYTTDELVTVPDGSGGTVEGVRASIILGGNDPYIVALKDGYTLAQLFAGNIPLAVLLFWQNIPSFYAFLDVVVMADGTKVVRVWDASRYPAHALYVGGLWRDERPFREGIEWTRDGPVTQDTAFGEFVLDSRLLGRTPFETFGSLGYGDHFRSGHGDHPLLDFSDPGTILSIETLESTLSKPLFPPLP
ncbi:hypothetical protein ACFQH3_20110 [Haladaptatus sp. GCM10025707]|uniref:hypothetical protein n=1 Tax=unclassified Haladaptatus TaxID=2622732 RepID=UPI0023E78254|nr:hypothetical protein [Haladaptatus sp. QDMS2]